MVRCHATMHLTMGIAFGTLCFDKASNVGAQLVTHRNLEKSKKIHTTIVLFSVPTFLFDSGCEIYTVFDEEFESEVENLEILHPDLEIQEIRKKY